MKKVIIIAMLATAGFSGAYFMPKAVKPNENKFEQQILGSEFYSEAADKIARQINDLSPMPPTESSWIVREVEFVKSEPYAYVTYLDTHNVFRVLVETGFKPYAQENNYRIVAIFEATASGWKLTHGEDLAVGRETVKINPN